MHNDRCGVTWEYEPGQVVRGNESGYRPHRLLQTCILPGSTRTHMPCLKIEFLCLFRYRRVLPNPRDEHAIRLTESHRLRQKSGHHFGHHITRLVNRYSQKDGKGYRITREPPGPDEEIHRTIHKNSKRDLARRHQLSPTSSRLCFKNHHNIELPQVKSLVSNAFFRQLGGMTSRGECEIGIGVETI